MKQIKLSELNTELTPSESNEVKGGLRITFSDLIVSSYQIGGSH